MIETYKCELCGVWDGCVLKQLTDNKKPRFCPRKPQTVAEFIIVGDWD